MPPEQIERLTHAPGPQSVVGRHVEGEAQLPVAPQSSGMAGEELALALVGVEGHQEVDGLVQHGEDARVVGGVLAHQPLQVLDGRAQRRVVVVAHGDGRVRPDAQRRLGDDAELAVAEQHALEKLRVLVLGALHDLAGGCDHLHGQRLIRTASEAGRVDVDAPHAERAPH